MRITNRIRKALPAMLMVLGLTMGASAAHAQPEPETDVPTVVADASDAAPTAPVPAPEVEAPATEAPTPEGDTAPEDAPDEGVGEGAQAPDGETVLTAIRRTIENRTWAKAITAILLILSYGLARKTLVAKIPWGIGSWFSKTDFGGMVGAFVGSFAGAWGLAAFAGGDLLSVPTIIAALEVGALAAGGYGGIWKKLPWVNSSSDESARV